MDTALRDRWLSRTRRRIAEAGLRTGPARARVVEVLARDAQCLVNAQTIVDRLRESGASASQASVYRVLDELMTLGLLRRVADEHGVARYEIADPETRHHHFVDEATGAVEPFEDRALESAIADVARRSGFELSGHEVVLRGRREPGERSVGQNRVQGP